MEKKLFHNFFQTMQKTPYIVRYWDGKEEKYGQGEPEFKIIFHDKIPENKILNDVSLAFGEAYMDGVIDFEGDLQKIIEAAYQAGSSLFKKKAFKEVKGLFRPKRGTSLKQQEKDIQHHYDLGNDFYGLWLDETMSYSCGYFTTSQDSLYQAQLNKIDYILKKLQIRSGERLLDIGSGWGWLIIRAAKQYGVEAVGITLSQEQYRKTKETIEELGLTGQVDVRLMDYRDLAKSGEKFDKVVSVGMVEHVGHVNLPKYFSAVEKLLVPQGVSLLHSITGLIEGPCNKWILKYIFPGGYIPSIRELIGLLPDYDFHLLDVESLRLHYAQTLDCWAKNFEKHVDLIREKYGERFVRMWRLYLNSCAASFRASGLNIHQILFSKGLNNNLEMTRSFLYQ
ncbi:MAG: class I SAM-dependent methyltransferase [Bacillota bacterium]|jgi:cyclopropane-fatty-acyl-phospholipid synthase